MRTKGLRKTLDRLRQTLTPNELTDEQLLQRFLAERDEAAFAGLVRRHGPMVLGVSRRMLGNLHDAEDVFQATFLVLAQKSRSLANRRAISGWLYTIAYRIALQVRTQNARRHNKEKQVEHMPQPLLPPVDIQDWQPILDTELNGLPEKYRVPLILCDLEGRPRKEVERQLRVAPGTLSGRLTNGRRLLAKRLARRGVVLSAGALATAMSAGVASASIPPGLVGFTTKSAMLIAAGHTAVVSNSVLSLTRIGVKAMFLAKLKATVATVVILSLVGAGGMVYSGAGQGQPKRERAQPQTELELLRKENELLQVNVRALLERINALEKQVGPTKAPANAAIMQDEYRLWEETARARAGRDKLIEKKQAAEYQASPHRSVDFTVSSGLAQAYLNRLELTAKALREAEDKDAVKRAIDVLEKAVKELRAQEKVRPVRVPDLQKK